MMTTLHVEICWYGDLLNGRKILIFGLKISIKSSLMLFKKIYHCDILSMNYSVPFCQNGSNILISSRREVRPSYTKNKYHGCSGHPITFQ